MLQDNPYVAKITATTHLNIIAKGSLMKGVYECQVGLSQFPRFNPHEVEGGFYCNIDTAKMVTGMTALGGGVYREAELTYILVTGPRTAVMIAKLHTPPPSLPLITAALHTSAGVAASGGCS